jgi:lipoprotein-releasing system permease protein
MKSEKERTMKWIGFVASRYVSRGRRNSPFPVFSVLGIATGVLALTVIISVMNGFQLGFIESILEVSSGHLRIENFPQDETGDRAILRLRGLKEVVSVLPFRETNVLVRGRNTSARGAVIRGLPPASLELDRGLAGKLEFEKGFFDLDYPSGIVLGAELAEQLFVREIGEKVSILTLLGSAGEDEGESLQYTVTGIFRCGFYEYDLGWAYINIDRAEKLAAGEKTNLQIKLKNRWRDRQGSEEVRAILEEVLSPEEAAKLKIVSWRDYNRAFFGALRTEKLLMFILVGLIFIVVSLGIFQSQRRIVLERQEEIGLLRALGASGLAVRLIFVWDGLVVGAAGASAGLLLGLLVAFNIPAFFTFLEGTVNFFIGVINTVLDFLGTGSPAEEFSVFSPQVFYLKEIPSRVIPYEAALIFFFGFLSALAAAWIASRKVSLTRPAEVLRYE